MLKRQQAYLSHIVRASDNARQWRELKTLLRPAAKRYTPHLYRAFGRYNHWISAFEWPVRSTMSQLLYRFTAAFLLATTDGELVLVRCLSLMGHTVPVL